MNDKWAQPKSIDGLTAAFGPRSIDELLPPYNQIPDEFKNRRSAWVRMIDQWFFGGISTDTPMRPREGVDGNAALKHIGAALRSFEPQHEHKTAGCAYLLSRWFDQFGEAGA